jgi:hypothetical protein
MNEQPVSERIKILLEKYHHGNKASMGRSLGVSGQAIADLIEGKKGGPSFPVLQKMLTIHPEVRAEWIIFGEEPMLKAKIELANTKKFVVSSADNIGDSVEVSEEQLSQVFQAAYMSFATNETVRQRAASLRAEVEVDRDRLTHVYWIGKPDPTRPYNGLLTERLGISEEEAKQLVLSGEILAGKFGTRNRITDYRIGEFAVQKFLEGMSADQQRAELDKQLKI